MAVSECDVMVSGFCLVITGVRGGENNNWHPVGLQWSGTSRLTAARGGLGHGAGAETKPCRCFLFLLLVFIPAGDILLLSQRWAVFEVNCLTH